MNNDCIVDWLKLYGTNRKNMNKNSLSQKTTMTSVLMDKGIEFEKHIIKYINDNIYTVSFCSNNFDQNSHDKTVKMMKEGIPIIHSASIINKKNNTGGIIDLLVRSDYLEKIVEDCPLTDEEKKIKGAKLSGNYHYVVIDIKFSTLYLKSDGTHLLNQNNIPAYKSQLPYHLLRNETLRLDQPRVPLRLLGSDLSLDRWSQALSYRRL